MLHPFVILLLVVGVLFFASWLKRQPPAKRTRIRNRALVAGAIVLGLVLLLRGQPVMAALGALLAFLPRVMSALQTVQLLKSLGGGLGRGTAQSGQASAIETRFLRVQLDHRSGEMTGEVIEGRFRGQRLEALDTEALLALLAECGPQDPESARVLEAYLDRAHGPDWRERATGGSGGGDGAAAGRAMTPEEAYRVLGLNPDAGREEIIEAHRRLMQKLHPDRGGSTFLAAQINRAKEVLLG